MEIKDMHAGDTVYCRLTGNACRGIEREGLIQEWEIVKIGRKYVTAKQKGSPDNYGVQFEILDGYRQKTIYCVDYILYPTEQEILDGFEINDLSNWFRNEFNSFRKTKYTLEKLRKAKECLVK